MYVSFAFKYLEKNKTQELLLLNGYCWTKRNIPPITKNNQKTSPDVQTLTHSGKVFV